MYSRKDIRVWYSLQRVEKDYRMAIVPVPNVVVVNGTLRYTLLRNDRVEYGMFTIPQDSARCWVKRNLSVSSHSESINTSTRRTVCKVTGSISWEKSRDY